MGMKMRHDALKVLLARAFKHAGFEVKMNKVQGFLAKTPRWVGFFFGFF